MAIDLTKFVKININYNTSTSSSAIRDTAVLFINAGSTKDYGDFTKLSKVLEDFSTDSRFKLGGELYYYVFCFFANGGRKLRIKSIEKTSTVKYVKIIDEAVAFQNTNQFIDTNGTKATPLNSNSGAKLYEYDTETETYVLTEDTEFDTNKTYYKDLEGTVKATPANCELYTTVPNYQPLTSTDLVPAIKELENEYIVITSNASYGEMFATAKLINQGDEFDIYSKMILSCIPEDKVEPSDIQKKNIANRGFALKYGVPGAEMAIAAYLTQINANQYNSVEDYYFTTETVTYKNGTETIGYVCEDNDDAEKLMNLHINFNSDLVNSVKNIGGDTTNEKDLVNEFMLILLHQTLTDRLVQLLGQKIRYNQTGLSLIGATISDELQKYVNNGFLTTDKAWTDPDLVQDGVTIIAKNTALQLGYKYVIMPFSTLTAEDRQEHKLPAIYILIADSYAIRQINITGELF